MHPNRQARVEQAWLLSPFVRPWQQHSRRDSHETTVARILPSFDTPRSGPQLEGLVSVRRVWQRAYTAGCCSDAVVRLQKVRTR